MQNINIGKSGIQPCRFSAWAPGPSAAVHGGAITTTALSVKAIQTAVEQGIQWIDTAPIYGLYHSEDRGGRSHEAHRPRQGGAFHQVRSGVAA